MSERLKMPPERDFGFYQRKKHDKWRAVAPPNPPLESPVADSHAHIHMLPEPAWELARCAVNGVDWVCMIVDPSEDGTVPFDKLALWEQQAATELLAAGFNCEVPEVRIAVGVHPHNAKLFNASYEALLRSLLSDDRVVALGEVGLDYHYDLSPHDIQRKVFRRQIELAQEFNLPLALHLRDGKDPQVDGAHSEAFAILDEAAALGSRTLLHCCALSPDDLKPWLEADCFVAYGGALTFKNADAAREGACCVAQDRLMLETDSPYMTPEPMRGAACTSAHIVFTAAALAEVRGIPAGEERACFLSQVHDNTLGFYMRGGEAE